MFAGYGMCTRLGSVLSIAVRSRHLATTWIGRNMIGLFSPPLRLHFTACMRV